jgi:hypothetical protein
MMFAVVFLGFTLGFVLAFGAEMKEFRNVKETVFTVCSALSAMHAQRPHVKCVCARALDGTCPRVTF